MSTNPRCPDCQRDLEVGFVPDATYGAFMTTHWHAGEPQGATFLGMPTGTKIERGDMTPILAYRCSECGLVRLYAR